MFWAIDTFVDLKVDPSTVVGNACEVVLIHEFLRVVGELDLDVFRAVKGRAEVEVFDVKAGKVCVWCRD